MTIWTGYVSFRKWSNSSCKIDWAFRDHW